MSTRLPQPRVPSPGEVVSPFVRVEESILAALRAPFANLGLPVPPAVPGPVALMGQVANQVPAPPQPPRLPDPPRLPNLDNR